MRMPVYLKCAVLTGLISIVPARLTWTQTDAQKMAGEAVYALDPDDRGTILWQVRTADVLPNVATSVGVLWGTASDGQTIYASTASSVRSRPTDPLDTRRNILDPKKGGGLTALRIADGGKVWYA